jgi:hypothetical protein
MSFTVKSLTKTKQVTTVESAGEATEVVSALQKRQAGAVKVEIHREGDDKAEAGDGSRKGQPC